MAGSLPRLPQRLRVRGETRRSSATSRTVNKSGRFFKSTWLFINTILAIESVCVNRMLFDYVYVMY